MTHNAMDDHIKQDLSKNIVNYDHNPLFFFPLVSLPSVLCRHDQNPKQALDVIFQQIIASKLYLPDASKWILPEPNAERPAEQIIPAFFNSASEGTQVYNL